MGYIILTTYAIPKWTIRNKELSIATYDFFTLYKNISIKKLKKNVMRDLINLMLIKLMDIRLLRQQNLLQNEQTIKNEFKKILEEDSQKIAINSFLITFLKFWSLVISTNY